MTAAAEAAAAFAAAQGKEIEDAGCKKVKAIDENTIRKSMLGELHDEIDTELEKRQHRLRYAEAQRDIDRQWDLVAAAVEEANIVWHNLTGDEAKRMRGRSKVTFMQDTANVLKQHDKIELSDEKVLRVQALNRLRSTPSWATSLPT